MKTRTIAIIAITFLLLQAVAAVPNWMNVSVTAEGETTPPHTLKHNTGKNLDSVTDDYYTLDGTFNLNQEKPITIKLLNTEYKFELLEDGAITVYKLVNDELEHETSIDFYPGGNNSFCSEKKELCWKIISFFGWKISETYFTMPGILDAIEKYRQNKATNVANDAKKIINDSRTAEAREAEIITCNPGEITTANNPIKECNNYLDGLKKWSQKNGLPTRGIDILLVESLAMVESSCQDNSTNGYGLLNVVECISTDNPCTLEENMDKGTKKLAEDYDEIKKTDISDNDSRILLLFSYNRGIGAAKRAAANLKKGMNLNDALFEACRYYYDKGSYGECNGFDKQACCGRQGTRNGTTHLGAGLGARYPEKVLSIYKKACNSAKGQPASKSTTVTTPSIISIEKKSGGTWTGVKANNSLDISKDTIRVNFNYGEEKGVKDDYADLEIWALTTEEKNEMTNNPDSFKSNNTNRLLQFIFAGTQGETADKDTQEYNSGAELDLSKAREKSTRTRGNYSLDSFLGDIHVASDSQNKPIARKYYLSISTSNSANAPWHDSELFPIKLTSPNISGGQTAQEKKEWLGLDFVRSMDKEKGITTAEKISDGMKFYDEQCIKEITNVRRAVGGTTVFVKITDLKLNIGDTKNICLKIETTDKNGKTIKGRTMIEINNLEDSDLDYLDITDDDLTNRGQYDENP